MLDVLSFLFNIAAGNRLSAEVVVYGDKEDAVVVIPERHRAMLKSEQNQIMQPKVEEVVEQQVELCEG